MSKFFKNMSYSRAFEKAMRYCSYQERSILDLEKRFYAWNVKKEDWDKLLDDLITDDFLNEKRYIEAYVRGKFLIKKWGKNKIKMGLMSKGIYDESMILNAFKEEISEERYLATIREIIEKKSLLMEEVDGIKKRDKLYRYLLSKGFESELVIKELKLLN